ncbi:MAG: hypothetical protein ABIO24_13130, partial [Saprospiraceae bacterium]
QSRVLVTVEAEQCPAFERFLQTEKLTFEAIGTVQGNAVIVDGEHWGPVTEWQHSYDRLLPEIMNA